ncbi:plasmid-related protein [Phaeovulum sp.]|uniref:plasmid-related protein n=1 Tax=Phaeovulum sp. TaxID=2934796 RepID=UPI003561771B
MATLLAMKDAGLRIRIDRELRERFLQACRAEDKPAAQVLRDFMRRYVEAQGTGKKLETHDPG